MAKKEPSYRESVAEIEKILNNIESGETDVDELADEAKRAANLLKLCKEKLFRMEQEVAEIIKESVD